MTTRLRIPLAAVATTALLLLPATAEAAPKKLVATVGPGFSITLKKGGKKVTSLKAGRYRIVVRDRSGIHNFHLKGRGVNKLTSVGGTGTSTWTVRLRTGAYRFQCDPHASVMHGSFRVR
jgi:plastocyanin